MQDRIEQHTAGHDDGLHARGYMQMQTLKWSDKEGVTPRDQVLFIECTRSELGI